jgi:hypothetical protein
VAARDALVEAIEERRAEARIEHSAPAVVARAAVPRA